MRKVLSQAVESALLDTQAHLTVLAQQDFYYNPFIQAFGQHLNWGRSAEIRQDWLSNDFSHLPEIELLSQDALNHANGAFSINTNTIYLSRSFVDQASVTDISSVLLEEIGHFLDAQLNLTDAPGDEGAIFSAAVLGKQLSEIDLQQLRAENDWDSVKVDGTWLNVEKNDRIRVSINDAEPVSEDSNSTAKFTITASNLPPTMGLGFFDNYLTVNYVVYPETADPSDYSNQDGKLVFSDKQPTQNLLIPISNDKRRESQETFRVKLTVPPNQTPYARVLGETEYLGSYNVEIVEGGGLGTILADEDPIFIPNGATISVDDAMTVTEGDNTFAQFNIQLSKPLPGTSVTGYYSTYDLTAQASNTSGRFTFNFNGTEPATLSQQVKVLINNDALSEDRESFGFQIFSSEVEVLDGHAIAIIEPDPSDADPEVSIVEYGNASITPTFDAIFNINLSKPSGRVVTVDYRTRDGMESDAASGGIDYQEKVETLFFQPGETTKSIGIKPIEGQPLKHELLEIFARDSAYRDLSKGDVISKRSPNKLIPGYGDLDYTVAEVYGQGSSDEFYALKLISDEKFSVELSNPINTKITQGKSKAEAKIVDGSQKPVFAIRGSDSPKDFFFADVDPRGVGWNQFQNHRDELRAAFQKTPMFTITGHSLGGTLAQLFAADYATLTGGDSIEEVVTFNATGINNLEPFSLPTINATHYITSGDIVSLAGESFLPGETYVLSSYGSSASDILTFKKHRVPVLVDYIQHNSQRPEALKSPYIAESGSIEDLNHFSFTYTDLDFLILRVIIASRIPVVGPTLAGLMSFRGTSELFRRLVGSYIPLLEAEIKLETVVGTKLWAAIEAIKNLSSSVIDIYNYLIAKSLKQENYIVNQDGEASENVVQLSPTPPSMFNPEVSNFLEASALWSVEAWNATTQWLSVPIILPEFEYLNPIGWNATTQWTPEAWNATTQWTPEAWNATTQWTEETWNATTQWTAQNWNTPFLVMSSAMNTEANSDTNSLDFVVSLSKPSSETISVEYTTLDDTAISGSDYLQTVGILSFAPGETSKIIRIPIVDDTLGEPSENVTLKLLNPQNALLPQTETQGTILDNDKASPSSNPAGILQFSSETYRIGEAETSGNLSIIKGVRVTRTGGNQGKVSAILTFTGGTALGGTSISDDYFSFDTTVTFEDGDAETKLVPILILDDVSIEGDETIEMMIDQPTGGSELGARKKAVITIVDNDAPQGTNRTVTTLEDTVYTFTTADFSFSDSNDTPANLLQAVQIITLPTVGSLTNNGVAVTVGALITGTDITSGRLRFTPASQANGTSYGSFTFRVQDNGDTANGGLNTDLIARTLTLDVTPVNDASSFTKGANLTITPGAGAQTLPNWATGFTPGPADESNQTVQAYLVNVDTNPAIFAVAPTINSSGTLTYTPATNVATVTTATLSVRVRDSGGTANGGADTSAVQTFTITVQPQPTLSIGNVSQREDNSGTTAFTFTVSLSAASAQTVTVNYTTADGTTTVADGDYLAATSSLTFAPGETSKTITINVQGDPNRELDETFLVNLLTPTNATLDTAANSGTGTIVNDDHVNLLWSSNNPATPSSGTGKNTIWQMNGFTLDIGYYLPTVDSIWQIVSTADFNHDGTDDLLWRNQASGQNAIWEMNSTGFQSGRFITSVGDLNWKIISTADFNNDGIADILWRNQASGQNAIWEMNSTDVKTGYYLTPVADSNWQIISTADLNNDGIADILWRNQASGQNAIWEMKRDFTLQSGRFITPLADANWQIVGTGDFNHDGIADLAWRNQVTGQNAIWQMNSTDVQTGYYLTPVADLNWQIAGIADFDGDGSLDLLWRNAKASKVSIWQMKGFTESQTYLLPDLSPDWVVRPLRAPQASQASASA